MQFGILSLVPVGISLGFFIIFKRIGLGLLLGAISAAFLLNNFEIASSISYFTTEMIAPVILNGNHVAIILFTVMVGALTGLLSKSGAISAFIGSLSKLIIGRKSAQTVTALSGLLIFFDDHANCLMVGRSMRKSCDSHQISREKLAFLVDSTAAPVASLALVSTWIAFQVGLIDDAIKNSFISLDAYALFIESIPYNFYALFTLAIVFTVASTGRDFGPMLTAERRASTKNLDLHPESQVAEPKKLALFYVPVLSLIVVTYLVLALGPKSTNSYMAMLIGASIALFVAVLILFAAELAEPHEAFDWILRSIKDLGATMGLLILAWLFAKGLAKLEIAPFLAQIFSGNLAPALWPTLVFAISALVSFATGTSFGTMAFLIPIALPTIFLLTNDPALYFATTAAILGGSVFGDHCSPISDTTILASSGSRCALFAHSSTQMPYALLGAFLAVVSGTLPLAFGYALWQGLLVGVVTILGLFRLVGREPHKAIRVAELATKKVPV
jgi:Na+/H+ antiporter NhaC